MSLDPLEFQFGAPIMVSQNRVGGPKTLPPPLENSVSAPGSYLVELGLPVVDELRAVGQEAVVLPPANPGLRYS